MDLWIRLGCSITSEGPFYFLALRGVFRWKRKEVDVAAFPADVDKVFFAGEYDGV